MRSNFVSEPGESMSFKELILKVKEYYKELYSKKMRILLVGFVGSVLGVSYSIIKKPVYTAELSFALEDDKSMKGLGGYASIAGQFGIDLGMADGGGAFSGDNLLELMKSRSMTEKALLTGVEFQGKKMSLADLYIDFNHLKNGWKTRALKNVTFPIAGNLNDLSYIQDSLLIDFHGKLIKKNLLVDKIDKKLSIIVVKTSTTNELFSKFYTEALVKNVADFYIETKTKKALENLAILQYQTDSVRKKLNQSISGVATSADLNPNPNSALQILRAPSQKRTVDVQANQAILTELVKNLEISKISLRKETPLIQIIDRPILPLYVVKFGKIKGAVVGFILCFSIAVFYYLLVAFYRRAML